MAKRYTSSMANPIRTRFAPSPTGYLHVGNARTALFSWLWARHNGGEFHLRIEDTDQQRLVVDAESQITEALTWLGLSWDGAVVHQSAKLERYQQHAEQLIASGHAVSVDEPAGTVIRFQWPQDPDFSISADYFQVGGTSVTRQFTRSREPTAFEDFVLIKSDGFPTYNFAHLIDDHLLGVTDVIRGDEFTSSLHKYVALHQAFGWQPPRFIHVPAILGPDQAKLSKRHGATDILQYRADGYLPEALVNFMALIGWSPGGDRELFFDRSDLVNSFSLNGLQRSPGVFDLTKLRWMNKQHMQNADIGELKALAESGGFWNRADSPHEERVFALAAQRAATLAEIQRDDYYTERPRLTTEQLVGTAPSESVGVWLERTQRYLTGITDWQADRLQTAFTDLLGELDLAAKQLFPVIREALTGAPQSPPLWEVAAILGQDETLARLEAAEALVR